MDEVTIARFWSKVDRRGPDDCWLWMGTRDDRQYGQFGWRKKASHISLEIDGRPREGKKHALHSCDNPPCVNPRHLRWGTDAENVADKVARGRHYPGNWTHCKKGHPLSGDNLLKYSGRRNCKQCQSDWNKAYRARKAEKKNVR